MITSPKLSFKIRTPYRIGFIKVLKFGSTEELGFLIDQDDDYSDHEGEQMWRCTVRSGDAVRYSRALAFEVAQSRCKNNVLSSGSPNYFAICVSGKDLYKNCESVIATKEY